MDIYWKHSIIRLFCFLAYALQRVLISLILSFAKGMEVTCCCFGIQGVEPAVTAGGELTVSITRGKEANKY